MVSRILLFATLVLASWPASGQTTPTFKSGVDLVPFDVRVVDGAGRPITDLRQDEIQVIENGAPLPVLLFQRLSEPAEGYGPYATQASEALSRLDWSKQ